ncbi:MAG TPA: SDR family oxidoreductase [Vicinamibacteria bacterium]|jgi:NAD(P)-dependent dehydrogenase (short-subunit alcohol dehydrogenase family)|nr:SDR family oxidoreductase [Vicinamibacteria bacterium]
MPTILITGANRGLGLEFVRQYAAEGWEVHACCRSPQGADELRALAATRARFRVHALDVADFPQIDALAHDLAGTALDVLLNNAGIFGPRLRAGGDRGQFFGAVDFEAWAQVMRVNTMAPLKMAEAFVEHVSASEQQKIITLGSSMGSIAETSGGFYAYRSSKAAVNMVMASLARDLAGRGIKVAVLCPGWVRTDMGGPDAPVNKEDSVRGLRRLIAGLTAQRSGTFTHYDGSAVAW